MAAERRSVSFPEDFLAELEAEAAAQDRSFSSLVTAYARIGRDRDPVRRQRLAAERARGVRAPAARGGR